MNPLGTVSRNLIIFACATFVLLNTIPQFQVSKSLTFSTIALAVAILGGILIWVHFSRNDPSIMDPFLNLLAFTTINTFPTVLLSAVMSTSNVVQKGVAISDPSILAKSALAHAVFLSSAGMVYYFLYPRGAHEKTTKNDEVYYDKLWVYMALFLFIVYLFVGLNIVSGFFGRWGIGGSGVIGRYLSRDISLLGGQLIQKLTILVTLLLSWALGVLAVRAKNIHSARRLILGGCALYFLFIYTTTTERAAVVLVGIGALSFADTVRWRGRLLNYKIFIALILLGMLLSSATASFERQMAYSKKNYDWKQPLETRVSLDFSPNRITGDIIFWIDNKVIDPMNFRTLRVAFENLIPGQLREESRVQSLSRWYAYMYNPEAAKMGQGYGFCVVAEGYMNSKLFGVFVEGILIGLFCAFIVSVKKRGWAGKYGPFLFSAYMTIVWRFYNGHIEGALKSFEWLTILAVVLLISFYVLRQRKYVAPRDVMKPDAIQGVSRILHTES